MKMGEVDGTRLAVLQDQLQQVFEDSRKAKEAAALAQREAARCEKLMGMIRRQIEAVQTAAAEMPDHGVTVSDHAIVRYLERHYDMDMNNLRLEMLDMKTLASIAFLKGGPGKINSNGLLYVVDNNTVITVKPTT